MGYGLFGEEELEAVAPPSPIVLREYQQKAKAAVLAAKDRGLHRVMVVMATGCGKTTVFASLVDEFERAYGAPSLVVAHRMELIEQAASRIASMSPRLPIGIEGGDSSAPFESRVVVAGVQTIGRPDSKRLNWFRPGLLIMDEGHHAPADTWQNVLHRFGAYDGSCFTLAVTATDHRMDNKPLHGHGAIFEDVVFRFGLRDAVRDGWLVDLRGYRVATGTDLSKIKTAMGDYNQAQLARAVNTEARNHTALKHWQEIAKDRRTIVFCVDIQHAKDVADLFKSEGIKAEHVDGTMKMDLRRGIMDRFRNGKTQVLVNVDVATEGFDVPFADCILMLRPTQSWALYAQMAGRGVRALPGTVEDFAEAAERRQQIAESAKPDCIVIDVVDVSKEFGLAAPPEPDGEPPPPKKPASATVAGLIGLPDDFDLEGHSLFEAAQRLEELEPARKAALFRRQTSWEDLSTVLTEVDLIRELSIPEEVLGMSRLAWMKVGDARYYLPCANSGMERDRSATLGCDELGRFTLSLQSSMIRGMPIPVGDDLQHAFDEADKLIRMHWPDAGSIVKADAAWRDKAPTEGQKELLKELGATEQELAFISTRGQARALIERKRLGLQRRQR